MKKWKEIILRRGTKEEKLSLKTAKCFARTTTEQNQENKNSRWVQLLTVRFQYEADVRQIIVSYPIWRIF